MKRSILCLLFLFLALGSTVSVGAQNFGPIEKDAEDASVVVHDDRIDWAWVMTHPINGKVTLQFSLQWQRGQLDAMQATYRGLQHVDNYNTYNHYVFNDPYLDHLSTVARELRRLAHENDFDELDVTLAFVQSLPYQTMESYQRYATETLIDGHGDCSETTVLLAGLCYFLGYRTVYIIFPGSEDAPGHAALGINALGRAGTFWTHRNRRYYFAETTGYGWKIGETPDDTPDEAVVIPVHR